MSYEKIIRRGRRRSLFTPTETTLEVAIDQEQIKQIIPHRDPFLLVDGIERVYLEAGTMRGFRNIDPRDPVFVGHFPDYPVYPGTLQMEMIGQLSLCLDFLISAGRADVKPDDKPRNLRLLKLHHALFVSEVRPGDRVTITSQLLEQDSYCVICAGQVMKGDSVCSMGVMEVFMMEDEEE